MDYPWFLRNPAVRSVDNIRFINGKGKYTPSYALAKELFVWTSVFYLTELFGVALAHSSLFPKASLKSYFGIFSDA